MNNWEYHFQPHILERGWRYANDGTVTDLKKTADGMSAIVRGSEYYKVEIHCRDGEVLDGYCSCPYAAGGEWCKHIAAVLYLAESGDGIKREGYRETKAQNVSAKTIIKKQIDSVFRRYSDRSGFINYYNAMGFSSELEAVLADEIGALIDDEKYRDAFEISIYAYIKLGKQDIDDDGEIASISSVCYELWKDIITRCSDEERREIRDWFEAHSDDGTVVDYMEEDLRDFLKYELASPAELKLVIRELEKLVRESRGRTYCRTVFTSHYGYDIEAIELRNILIRRLGAADDAIEEYMRDHMSFISVRKYFLEKARDEGDVIREIDLLKQSKEYDKEDGYLVHGYSKRLIELYNLNGSYDLEKQERREDIYLYQNTGIGDFRAYRNMCSKEEWQKERIGIIRSRENTEDKCELLAEERMIDELFALISKQKNKVALINKYGFIMADKYSEQILSIYASYVSDLAENACNQSRYDNLLSYLQRMMRYPGGVAVVRPLVTEWTGMYPGRKIMIQRLRAFLDDSRC